MRIGGLLLAAIAVLSPVGGVHGQIQLDPPGERAFILDRADLLSEVDEAAVRVVCDKLLTEHVTPIIVVTIDRMADHLAGNRSSSIESFAKQLFNQWRIGHPKLNDASWNTGMLLLVSKGDRKARIELGAGWGRQKDTQCGQIMDERIIPEFKAGDFAAGIRSGVFALDVIARGKKIPPMPMGTKYILLWLLFLGVAVFTGVSLYRRGSSGWAWVVWALVFSALGSILYHFYSSRGSTSFGGGSFGGGFSGGGGASGSW